RLRVILRFHHILLLFFFFFFQAEDGIRDGHVTGVQTCALPISNGLGGNHLTTPPKPFAPLTKSATPSPWAQAGLKSFNSSLACRSEERRVGKECRSRWSSYH